VGKVEFGGASILWKAVRKQRFTVTCKISANSNPISSNFPTRRLFVNKRVINHPDKEASDSPYSAGVLIDGWLYISGQGPLDMRTGQVVQGTIEEETRLTLNHILKILQAAGGSTEDVVKCTCHLRDVADFDRFNAVYKEFFSGIRPARTTVQSVLWGGIKIEIDAVARIASTP
jgi:2-iminobutanoate/2-iminopropanoate deaminase